MQILLVLPSSILHHAHRGHLLQASPSSHDQVSLDSLNSQSAIQEQLPVSGAGEVISEDVNQGKLGYSYSPYY